MIQHDSWLQELQICSTHALNVTILMLTWKAQSCGRKTGFSPLGWVSITWHTKEIKRFVLGFVPESQKMGHSGGPAAWLSMWCSLPCTEPGAETAAWILKGGVIRCASASWDAVKQQVCGGEGFLHCSGWDSGSRH